MFGGLYTAIITPFSADGSIDLGKLKELVEIQGTAERDPFNDKQLRDLLALADKGIKELIDIQKKAVGDIF